jgi:hypothetical protein
MEPHFEIRLAGRIEPRPKPAATDERAIAVIEYRPILYVIGPLPLVLGAELLSDLGLGEFAAGINERRDSGIAPQFHRKGKSSFCHGRATRRSVLNFSISVMIAAENGPLIDLGAYSCASQRYRRKWDREFESGLLQERVHCELDRDFERELLLS